MLRFEEYKGLDCIVIENNYISASILPELGGKICSLVYKEKNFEFASKTTHPFIQPDINTPFDKADASGIDDTFPNILAEEVNFNNTIIHYTDHGEIWRSKMEVEIKDYTVHLTYKNKEKNYLFRKSIKLDEKKLKFDYEIKNLSNEVLPCIYTMHGLVRYEEDMQLIYPKGTYNILNVCDSNELGKDLTIHPFNNDLYDFTKLPKKSDNTYIKYYLNGTLDEGVCGYVYPSQQVKCLLTFDKDKLPYLGLWATIGKFRNDYNLAFEPSTGFYDGITIAMKNNKCPLLTKEPIQFNLAYEFFPYSK